MKEPIIQIFSWQLICNLINEQRKKCRNLNLHILIFITVNSCVSYALFSTISSKHSGCKVTNEQRFTLILTVDFCITEEWNRHLISSMNGIDIHLYNCSFLIINKHTSFLNTNMHESEFYSLFLLWKKNSCSPVCRDYVICQLFTCWFEQFLGKHGFISCRTSQFSHVQENLTILMFGWELF